MLLNIIIILALCLFTPAFYAKDEDHSSDIKALFTKVNYHRANLIRLFNDYTQDKNLHFVCPKTTHHKRCDVQLKWKHSIQASAQQKRVSQLRDQAVFQQINILIKSKPDFKQRFIAFKKAESDYLKAISKIHASPQS